MPRALLASALMWPNIVRLSRAFLEVGFVVGAIANESHPIHRSRAPHRTFSFRPTAPLQNLGKAITAFRPDIVIPCDDRAVGQLLRLRALGSADLVALIETSLGRGGATGALSSPGVLAELNELPDVKAPRTNVVATAAELRSWAGQHGLPAVLKLDGRWGGRHVAFVRDQRDIAHAFLLMRMRRSALRRMKRLVFDWDFEPPPFGQIPLITVQSFVAGRPANLAVACWRGRVTAQIAVEVVCSLGPFGNASVVRVMDGEAMLAAARSICGHYELSGIYGFDFVIEAGSEIPYLVEINSRATQTSQGLRP
jgi:hypothetical protein